jgi:arylsulfatase
MIKFMIGLVATFLLFNASPLRAAEKPNIVLIFMDNFGWGELGFNGGGIIHGAATPPLGRGVYGLVGRGG